MKTRVLNHRILMRWGAVVAAIASSLIAWTMISPVGGTELTVPIGAALRTVGAVDVAFAVVVTGLAAVGTAILIERRSRRPRRTWTILSTSVFVLTLLGPITTGADLPTVMSLIALHSVVAAVLIPQIRFTLRQLSPHEVGGRYLRSR